MGVGQYHSVGSAALDMSQLLRESLTTRINFGEHRNLDNNAKCVYVLAFMYVCGSPILSIDTDKLCKLTWCTIQAIAIKTRSS